MGCDGQVTSAQPNVKIRHRLLTATKRGCVYCHAVRQRKPFSRKMALPMMVDPHSLGFQLPCLCLLWKAAPSVVSSLGGAAQSQLLELRRDNPALIAARLFLMSLHADYAAKPRKAKETAGLARLDYRAPR
jgi:hypothetical protein